jgi:hypothetical protein
VKIVIQQPQDLSISLSALFEDSSCSAEYLPMYLDQLENSINQRFFNSEQLILSDEEETEWLESEMKRKNLSALLAAI